MNRKCSTHCTEEARLKILLVKLEAKIRLETLSCSWEDGIKMDINENMGKR
jgi:hypothetical protein